MKLTKKITINISKSDIDGGIKTEYHLDTSYGTVPTKGKEDYDDYFENCRTGWSI